MRADPVSSTMRLYDVVDPDSSEIAAYRNLRDRDLVRHDSFIAEGKVVLRALFSAGRFEARSLLILRNRLDGMRDILDLVPGSIPIYVAEQAVLDAVAAFHLHRGVLAHVARPGTRQNAGDLLASLPRKALVVVLVGIGNHDNVGAIFRNAAAFDCDAVLLDETSCDPLYRKAIRVSVGAALQVPFAHGGSATDLLRALAENGFTPIALSPGGEIDLTDLEPMGRPALLFGSEGDGLPPEIMARIRTVRIAMSERFDSLNVAAASAIALHHLGRFGPR